MSVLRWVNNNCYDFESHAFKSPIAGVGLLACLSRFRPRQLFPDPSASWSKDIERLQWEHFTGFAQCIPEYVAQDYLTIFSSVQALFPGQSYCWIWSMTMATYNRIIHFSLTDTISERFSESSLVSCLLGRVTSHVWVFLQRDCSCVQWVGHWEQPGQANIV